LATSNGGSWHYFADAARLLVHRSGHTPGPGGLSLYQSHPEFQFGPFAIAVTAVFLAAFDEHARVAAQIAMMAVGVTILVLIDRAAPKLAGAWRRQWTVEVIGGALFLIAWTDIALRSAHIDDALALLAAVIALWALATRRHWLIAAVCLGVGASAKPWAILFLPMLWALPRNRRLPALLMSLIVTGAGWVPFFVADHATARAGQFIIDVAPNSVLHLVGIAVGPTPHWDRLIQLAVGIVVAVLAARRGRWPGVVLVAIATRLLLDPGAHHYYTAGLVLAALVWEATAAEPPVVPWLTAAVFALLELSTAPTLVGAAPASWMRLIATSVAIVMVLREPTAGASPGTIAWGSRPASA
jgi:hypothetical protein